ncbi:MAG: hypothetical protein IJ958_02725 [Agathobacter sp.]|nr:hypothetical protein [Agathobacter sp.]
MKQKYKSAFLVLTMLFFLTGCGEAELEEREFPMFVGVGYEDERVTFNVTYPKRESSTKGTSGEKSKESAMVKKRSFEECIVEYESRLNKQADYNHLKVFVMEEDLLQQEADYYQMLDYLAKTERFPRNTYVCVVDDVEDLLELEKNLSQDLGAYLEEYIKKHEEAKAHILTLGDLLDEKENQTIILYMPYLEVEDNYLKWNGYVNILGEIWKDF